MSAFVVSPQTLQRCVSALHNHSQACEDADELGRRLIRLNIQAVQHRYPRESLDTLPGSPWSEEDIEAWRWRVTSPLVDGIIGIPADLAVACDWLKALHCLRYQMSEGEEVPASDLYRQITERAQAIADHLAAGLPEYQAAAWDS